MSRLKDYSKWDHIELSDDDLEDLPPTLDKDSMKKYTKAKRAQRDNEEETRRDELKRRIEKASKELRQMGEAGRKHMKGQQLEKQVAEDAAELEKLERTLMRRVNADNIISTEQFSKGVVSSEAAEKEGYKNVAPTVDGNVDEAKFEAFVKKNEKVLTDYVDLGDIEGTGGLRRSCEYILRFPEIILSSDAETFCMFHCLGLEMEGKSKEMSRAARQGQLISQALQLSKMLAIPAGQDPTGEIVLNRKGTENMLEKLQADEDLQKSFAQQTEQFIARIKKRAIERLAEEKAFEAEKAKNAAKNAGNASNSGSGSASKSGGDAANSKGKESGGKDAAGKDDQPAGEQIGPGGLDAQEVFDTLPEKLQDAFLEKDLEKLQKAFGDLPEEESDYHLKRCVMSGLWVVPGYGGGDGGRESDSD